MNQPRITVVVVTYRSAATIRECLLPIRAAHESGVCECIVVDNQSPDNTRAILNEHENWATVIDSGGNIGFGRACNIGLERATTPYVMFLNPDGRIDASALGQLERFMDEHPNAMIAAPAIHEPDGELQHVGVRPSPGSILAEALGRPRNRRPVRPGEAPFRTDWVCGAAMFCRAEAVRAIGGFDPRFFLYFEETDLCRRVEESGGEIWAVGESVAHHANAVSAKASSRPMFAGCIAEHYFQSRYYYLRKHWGPLVAAGTEICELALMSLRALVHTVAGHGPGRFAERLKGPVLSCPAPGPGASPMVQRKQNHRVAGSGA